MLQGWIVIPISLAYLGLLFLVAWFGDKHKQTWVRFRPWIYSLSIAVYCTSWTFYGTVGQAVENMWAFIPIYFAPFLVYAFGWPILSRIIQISKREHITSIADFIASRYGKSQGLAVTVTLIALVGVLPYIALQLRAVTMGIDLVAPNLIQDLGYQDVQVSGFVTAVLAIFSILFGTRHIDNTEHHRGMMLAIAFESLVKLVAFLVVGGFILGVIFYRPDLSLTQLAQDYSQAPHYPSLIIHMLLAIGAVLCLPRQFHTSVVENQNIDDLKTARWVMPLYLFLMALFVLPIAWAGQALLSGQVADTYVVQLPLEFGAPSIAMLAILGGTSAASAMVIVSSISLTIMVANDWVLPLLLRHLKLTNKKHQHISGLLLNIRRSLILLILFAAWWVYQLLDTIPLLSVIGLLSFAAIAQLMPALLGGIFWKRGNKNGVYAGLLCGFAIWLITLMSHTQMLAGDASSNFLLWLIEPPQWAHALKITTADWGMALSGVVNLVLYVLVSLVTHQRFSERMQAAAFVEDKASEQDELNIYHSRVTVAELEVLAARFVGRARMRESFKSFEVQYQHQMSEQNQSFELDTPLAPTQYLDPKLPPVLLPQTQAPPSLILHTERLLAGVFGASSARLVLTSALQGRSIRLEEVATIVDEASEIYDFSRGLLQGAIEHISQGISVVDKQLRLVAWNQRYLELFEYPEGLIQVGRPIAQIIAYNAKRGLCGEGSASEHVQKRVEHLKRGTAHKSSRVRESGQVIEIQGHPMPNGGFVMSFTDITDFTNAEKALRQAKDTLEERVQERTQALEQANHKLMLANLDAKLAASEASQASMQATQALASKNKLLAAVSHDLMQPLNAARLFASSLLEISQKAGDSKTSSDKILELAKYIDSSLGAAESLISDLLDMSRLSSGKVSQQITSFSLQDLFNQLDAEFSILAKQQGIDFVVVKTCAQVRSDPKLLRRILQNLLTNAFRYTQKNTNTSPKVVLGVRRLANHQLAIQVWDNGIGIAADKQQEIFDEFTRVDKNRADQGLGLGLSIAKGMANLLSHELSLQSWLGAGSVFSVLLERATPTQEKPDITPAPRANQQSLSGCKVLCIDNDEAIILGMRALLEPWGCEVKTAQNLTGALQHLITWQPDVVLSDYHLDEGELGLDVIHACRQHYPEIQGVVISADRSDELIVKVREAGFMYLTKPVKPLKLRQILNNLKS